jgi:cytochrome b561
VWSTHVVLGLTLAVVLAMRILWQASFGRALPPADTGVLQWLAKGTHYTLYLLVLTGVVLGIVNASYMGFDLYGVLTVPRLGDGDPSTERSIDTLHEWAANLLVVIAFFHAAAALGHQYIWGDRVLQRMRPRLEERLSKLKRSVANSRRRGKFVASGRACPGRDLGKEQRQFCPRGIRPCADGKTDAIGGSRRHHLWHSDAFQQHGRPDAKFP